MNFPKNIVQIGTLDNNIKVYIEDYVYTFMKQVEQENYQSSFSYIIFGREEWYQNCHYLFIYGAIEETEENKIVQQDYFKTHQMIGKLESDLVQKKIQMKNGISTVMNGFYIFYEQNPEMQSYLVHMNRKIEITERGHHYRMEKNKESVKDKNIAPMNKENKQVSTKRKKKSGLKVASFWTGIVATMLLIIGISYINGYTTMNQFVTSMGQALLFEEPMEAEDTEFIIVEKTTEEKLEEEMQQSISEDIEAETIETNINDTKESESNSDEVEIGIEVTEEILSSEVVIEDKGEKEDLGDEQEEQATQEDSVEHEVYIIQEGDTLASVCEAKYQTTDRISEVCSLNNIDNPDRIIQGQAIILPLE